MIGIFGDQLLYVSFVNNVPENFSALNQHLSFEKTSKWKH